jgi:hypothetical protein
LLSRRITMPMTTTSMRVLAVATTTLLTGASTGASARAEEAAPSACEVCQFEPIYGVTNEVDVRQSFGSPSSVMLQADLAAEPVFADGDAPPDDSEVRALVYVYADEVTLIFYFTARDELFSVAQEAGVELVELPECWIESLNSNPAAYAAALEGLGLLD